MSFGKTDKEIILSYKEGNLEVFKFLIERYSSALFNFSSHLVGRENAVDVVQEVYIKIWKKIDKFDVEKSSFKNWIFTITKNTSIDFLRKNKSINFSEMETNENDYSFSETIPDEGLLPNEIIQKIQDKELLEKLLEKISQEEKTILILHYQEDMTFDEIGDILNKPLNTVKSQHRRSLIKIRKML